MIILFWIIGLIFVGLAIPLMKRKVGPNALYGLRVGETMENEAVWYEANARSARDLIRLGLGLIVVSGVLFFLPWRDGDHYVLVTCGLLVAGVVWYCARGIRIAREVKRELGNSREGESNDSI